MTTCQELYGRAKKDPNAIINEVGEPDPFIIHEAHALVTYKDGSEGEKVIYTTFEFAKKHLKKLKRCGCGSCQGIIEAYRVNRKAMRCTTPKELFEMIPGDWMREH